jgi:signal transduction histidine kinase
MMREEFSLQLLVDYVLLNEILLGPSARLCLQKIGMKQGERVENRFRSAFGYQEKLTVAQFAELCLDFLGTIGGGYTRTYMDEDLLTLTAQACPFGHRALKAPALCETIISLLGEIAARNFPYCKVNHEQTMAKHAPACRLTFFLQETEEAAHAQGQVFVNNPTAYLLTPGDVRTILKKENRENSELRTAPATTTADAPPGYEMFADVQFGIMIMDITGKITYINKKGQELTESIGGADSGIVASVCGILQETLNRQTRMEQQEVCVTSAAGRRYYVMNTTPLFYKGRINGAVCLFNYMPEEKTLEKELIQLEKYTLLAELAAGTAHEIRNPLTTIRGFLQVLAKEFLPDSKGYEYCYLMVDEIDRANSIITEFLLLTKPAAPRLRETNLHAILEEIFLLIESKSLLENVELSKHFAKSLPLVNVDSAQIKQVFLNLATNAIHAMPEGGRLTISTSAEQGKAVVRFTDTGQGISEHQLAKIFEPFYPTKEQGTGLGLAISARIMENHHGRLTVESIPGKGTTFSLELPAV